MNRLITKAIVRSIDSTGKRCKVRMPLFESASDLSPVEAEALVSITPGMFNNLFVGDIVLVAFEENALEKPIILGKLYKGTSYEEKTPGGAAVIDSLLVRTAATQPCTTFFVYPDKVKSEYVHLNTPKKIADYIKWLESLTKKLTSELSKNFTCFKKWTQWQLRPENVEIDDGDIDSADYVASVECQYQNENGTCKICKNCTNSAKENKREHITIEYNVDYPKLTNKK